MIKCASHSSRKFAAFLDTQNRTDKKKNKQPTVSLNKSKRRKKKWKSNVYFYYLILVYPEEKCALRNEKIEEKNRKKPYSSIENNHIKSIKQFFLLVRKISIAARLKSQYWSCWQETKSTKEEKKRRRQKQIWNKSNKFFTFSH